ncbi:MAG TPA: isocitrate/isopropylmalate family dehydrogenase, partial [Burkholderiaceae bacterium]|nr:isocitrate/isopropylmalate family dehydrogenase [Burkholderiaceae bacterium]
GFVGEAGQGVYRGIDADGNAAVNTMTYSRPEIERVTRVAFKLAQRRKKKSPRREPGAFSFLRH